MTGGEAGEAGRCQSRGVCWKAMEDIESGAALMVVCKVVNVKPIKWS